MLASCAQDDLVVKPDYSTDGAPVSFAMKIGNMSRSNTALNEAGFNSFGVWAVKAEGKTGANGFLGLDLNLTSPGSEHANVVMNNYWVKYCANEHYGSFWSYVPADWSVATLPSTNTSGTQYLKYWDGSVTNTYFAAYGPGVDGVSFSNGYSGGDPTMTFPLYTTAADANTNYIYSDIQECTNADYINPSLGSTDNPKKVPLQFYRLLSQVKIAFWEDIPGYTIELNDITFDTPGGTAGVAAMPATYSGTVWQKGEFVYKAKPVVTYDKDNFSDISVAYTEAERSDASTDYQWLNFTIPSGTIGETRAARTYSTTVYNVLPNDDTISYTPSMTSNDGLQFVVNYTLKSKDTSEEIKVKGARVFVPANFTAWAKNTVYTYIFQITKNSSGTTTTTDPKPYPDEAKDALYPIIFDGVMVQDLDKAGADKDFVINQKLTDLYININDGLMTPQTLALNYAPDAVAYKWYSSKTGVATVVEDGTGSGANTTLETTVTPVAVGTSTISAKDPSTAVVASCTVYVYDLDTSKLAADVATVAVAGTTTLTSPFASPLTWKWSTSDASKATVSDAGVVTGVENGTATITCSSTIGGVTSSKSWTVTVTAP